MPGEVPLRRLIGPVFMVPVQLLLSLLVGMGCIFALVPVAMLALVVGPLVALAAPLRGRVTGGSEAGEREPSA